MEAISHATRVLDWLENMTPDEVPPEWMWVHPDALAEHFDEVRAKRGQQSDSDDFEPPMTKNEDPRLLALQRR